MIDLHSHILPKMDDGSQSVEESMAILAALQQQGVTTLAATPHFYPDQESPEDFLARRQAAMDRLPTQVAQTLIPGAEVAYFSGIGNSLSVVPLQLGNTGLLLVEMPFRPWTDRIISDIIAIPSHLGLTPVLAHVDRYRLRSQFPKYCKTLLENDVLFQCNADVFETRSGSRWACNQLKKGYIHFFGSDSHNMASRAPKLHLVTQTVTKKFGPQALETMTADAMELLKL